MTMSELVFRPFVQHVHRPQVECDRIVGVCLGGFTEFFRNLQLRFAEDDPDLTLS